MAKVQEWQVPQNGENNETVASSNSLRNDEPIKSIDDFPDLHWFDETVCYPAVSVPIKHVAYVKKTLKSLILQDQKNVYDISDVLSDVRKTGNDISMISEQEQEQSAQRRIIVFKLNVAREEAFSTLHGPIVPTDSNGNTTDYEWIDSFPITRGYNDMTVDEILRKLLPVSIQEIPTSYELVGHIAHLNVRDDCLPYKYWIGKVVLDLNQPTIRVVVNKVGTIDNVFRTFDQEVLATTFPIRNDKESTSNDANNATDDKWSITTVYEHGCSYTFDYRHVYWNSRLSGEHHRLVKYIQKDFKETILDLSSSSPENKNSPFIVVDLMAGVGPFAIPLTTTICSGDDSKTKKRTRTDVSNISIQYDTQHDKNRITVYANDLNPISYKYLQINAKKNKCTNLHCNNQDARMYIRELSNEVRRIDHIIMNLPGTAIEFLDIFHNWPLNHLPEVHVYCFGNKSSTNDNTGSASSEKQESRKAEKKNTSTTNQSIINRCIEVLGCTITEYNITVVRNISPTKNMFCVTFRLPCDLCSKQYYDKSTNNDTSTADPDTTIETHQPEPKRIKNEPESNVKMYTT